MKFTLGVALLVLFGLVFDGANAGVIKTNGKWGSMGLTKKSKSEVAEIVRRKAQEEMPGPLVDGVEDMGEQFQPKPMDNFDDAIAALMDEPDFECEMLGEGACEPEFWDGSDEMAMLTAMICPKMCDVSAEDFCKGDQDELAYMYLTMIGVPDEMLGESCEDAKRMFGSNELIQHPDGELYQFCEEPGAGFLCQEACDVNCWSWPPPETTKVYLPGCGETIAVPSDMHRFMYKNTAQAGDATICPP